MCKHLISQGRDGEQGSWCIDCGEKVLEVEWRECRHCAHFKATHTIPICTKKLMAVLPDMHVTYRFDKGTCWEEIPMVDTDLKRRNCANCGKNDWVSAGFPVSHEYCNSCGASR
jgi:hypothetical protein